MKFKKYRGSETAAQFESTSDLLDSTAFHSDCLNGLNARMDCDVKFDKVDTEYDFIRFIGKMSPELYLNTHEFKGLIELESYLKKKYWNSSVQHLSITVWSVNKSTVNIEISMSSD